MKLTSDNMRRLGVVEHVFSEKGLGGGELYGTLKNEMINFVCGKMALPVETLLQQRYERFRRFGAAEG